MSKGVRHPFINLILGIATDGNYFLILCDYKALEDKSVFTGITYLYLSFPLKRLCSVFYTASDLYTEDIRAYSLKV